MGTRSIGRLSARKFATLYAAGRHCDGGGLYLQVGGGGARSWIFRFQKSGQIRDMGLGSAQIIGLADAREFAAQCRTLVAKGVDPIEEREKKRQQKAAEAAATVTFKECALRYIKSKRLSWRNAKHAAQWPSSLEAYAYPAIGHLPVAMVNTNAVLKVLGPIWETKTATAGRVRERIEAVLEAAKTLGLRTGDNPARWRGHLENLLPKPAKVQQVKHHAALPFGVMNSFITRLRKQEGLSARLLEFLILTATRTGEALGASWKEIDLGAAKWTIPADRMKAGREHIIPLSQPAITLLRDLEKYRQGDFVFAGRSAAKTLSTMAMSNLLERMGLRGQITVHGFRSTFRDWVSEQTDFPNEVVEMALAHSIGNKVEAAYRRGDLYEKRQKLMAEWAAYCDVQDAAPAVLTLVKAS